MENKDVKMPPKTRGPMRGPGRGMMPGEKAKDFKWSIGKLLAYLGNLQNRHYRSDDFCGVCDRV